ncbi:substrate-binding domain-containing protein [Hoeflea sp.]|uniref:substrate-binding domain-containing protein n=1 Tax=Hoeflea sp. TaxID=1940281 RepID=UPI003B0226F0
MSKVSLKALSEKLGLTEGTVSRALNNYTDISEKTRERVRAAAQEMGYRPNSSARRLATGNAECVGYVMSWQLGHLSEPFLGELLDGLSESLSERHWDLTLAVSRSAQDELAIISRMAQSGRVNGFVISRTLTHDPRVDHMREIGIPFVTHGRTANSDAHAWFDIDNYSAFREAVAHLCQLGHKRISHIRGPLEYNFAASRHAGYRRGLLDHGLDLYPEMEAKSDMSENGGYRAMRYLLSLQNPPTAVVCVSDSVALGAMKAIRERGWRPGREVSVIGYDGLPLGEHTDPPLTTMAQPLQTAGRKIGDMLLAVVDGADPKQQQELWSATLERRETDGPPVAERN